MAGPLVATGDGGWRWAVAAMCGLTAVVTVAALAGLGHGRAPVGGAADPGAAAGAGPVPRAFVALLLASFFAYTGVEVATGAWAFTLLTDERGMGDGPAGLLVAAYFGALTVARVGLAVAGPRVGPAATLRACVALAVAGSAVLAADPLGAGPVGLVVMGAALGPVFPLAIGFAGQALGPWRATVVIGWCVAVAGTGGPVVTAVAGRAADRAGLDAVPATLAGAAAVLAAAVVAVTVAGRR